MGQFKPMVKMMTTEPSVELKLKKGGAVKKADGGMMGALAMPSSMPARGGMAPAMAPKRPSMAMRRKAMAVPPAASRPPMMKEGGETKAEHMAEMKKMGKVEKELKAHESKPASKAHKGLATGGVAKSPKPGNYKTGGVVMGQGGYKKGGEVAKSGIINTENQGGAYRNTKMHTAPVDHDSAPTGEVKLGKPGGYKKGGSAKKAYATGGLVDTGRPVAYPKKPTSKPVKNTMQSGTFKKGGSVKMAGGGYTDGENDPMIAKEARRREAEKAMTKAENEATRDAILGAPKRIYEGVKNFFTEKSTPAGSVTKTEKSVTVTPKKRGGSVKC